MSLPAGSLSGGVPAAIALTPILSARYHAEHLALIREAAPGARLVNVSLEGLADDADLEEVEVVLRGPMQAEVFDRLLVRCPRIRWVHSATAGVERVLTPAALERGLTITNARGVFSRPIAEYVMMMILAVSRRLPQLLELQRERTWQPLEAVEIRDVTVGIVGFGSIGQAVASLATAFGCRIVATRRGDGEGAEPAAPAEASPIEARVDAMLRPDQLPELLRQSDFVVLALPLTSETEELFDERMLSHMKRSAWLINVARGRLVNERDLLRALRQNEIGGAVLDAFREEPLPPDSRLYGVPNVILTPHTAWSSGRVLNRSIELFCDNLRRFARGEPLRNVVDPSLGY
ncbi:MAG: D-2-hydroxyacid dehydrogenase [Candidatus Limnocylindrales bacterium]